MKRNRTRKRCGALLDRSGKAFDRVRDRAAARGQDPDAAVLACLHHRGTCTRPALPDSKRCQWHGGRSTGPIDGGAGRRRMVDEVHAKITRGELERVPWGRRKGGTNRPKAVIEAEKCRRETARTLRQAAHQSRIAKRKRKEARRAEERAMAEHYVRNDLRLPWDAPVPEAMVKARLRWIAQEHREAAKTKAAEARKQREKARSEAELHPSPKRAPTPRGRINWLADCIIRDQQRRLELSPDQIEEPEPPGEVRAASPSTREQPPIERRDEAPAKPAPPPPPAVPDSFRDTINPCEAVERELKAELAELESMLLGMPLSESSRVSLDGALRYARGVEERVQVLRRWFTGMQQAYAMSEAITGHLRDRAELRSAAPRQEERPRSITPWLRR
jgi:hypothetical protein